MPDYTIIGLAGYAGSGKDAIAKCMIGYYRVAFADALKQTAAFAVGVGVADLERNKSAVRPLLVEVGRVARMFDPYCWVHKVDRVVRRARENWIADRFVVSDVRYLNEAEWIDQRGGRVFYVSRPGIGPANDEERQSIVELREVLNPTEIVNDARPEDAAAKIMELVKGCVKV